MVNGLKILKTKYSHHYLKRPPFKAEQLCIFLMLTLSVAVFSPTPKIVPPRLHALALMTPFVSLVTATCLPSPLWLQLLGTSASHMLTENYFRQRKD